MGLTIKFYIDGELKEEINGEFGIVSMDNRVMACGLVDRYELSRLTANIIGATYNIAYENDNSHLMKYLAEICYNAYNMIINNGVQDVYQDIKHGNDSYKVDTSNYLKQMWESQLKDLFDNLNGDDTNGN